MKLKRLFPQGIKLYIKQIGGVFSHWKCFDIDSVFVSSKANLEENVKVSYNVKIGDNVRIDKWTYIEEYTFIENADIGKFCSIGPFCQIGPWEHPYRNISMSPVLYRRLLNGNKEVYDDDASKVIIGNDVWIGCNVIILGGNRIGDGAIIGAGSVVTKDVAPYSIVAGNPAKVIKYRFDTEKINILEEIKWWNWSTEKIIENRSLFESKESWFANCKKFLLEGKNK